MQKCWACVFELKTSVLVHRNQEASKYDGVASSNPEHTHFARDVNELQRSNRKEESSMQRLKPKAAAALNMDLILVTL